MSGPQTVTHGVQPKRLRLAHISDPHLTSLRDVDWRDLLNKRMLGYVSWRWHRRNEHLPGILHALRLDLAETRPDHIAITGDLTHLGTPAECREVRDWLEHLGPPDRISVIPGNHDTYAPAPWSETLGQWLPYMQADEVPRLAHGPPHFPFLRCRGPLALICLSTARPTPPFLATGRLGRWQIDKLEKLLDGTAAQGLFRVILLHHSPASAGISRRRRLDDAAPFRAAIQRHGAELVLHGHAHEPIRSEIKTAGAAIPVFGVPSASAFSLSPARRAGYNIYDVTATGAGWELHVYERLFQPGSLCFAAGVEHELSLHASTGRAHDAAPAM